VATTLSSEVTIGVGDFNPPTADAGLDQTVHRRDVVTLDGTGSSQDLGHDLGYHWEQTAGVPVTLSDADAAQPTFTAPETPGTLMFELTVTDEMNPNPATASATDSVQIDVQDYAAPIANAGPNQTNIDIDDTVTLDGSASSQLDLHALTYQWTQVAGPAVTLSDATAVNPSFTAPIGPATLQFELVVDDTFNSSAPATVYIDVNGIAGLDFSANIIGDIKGETAASSLTINVVNNGTIQKTVTSSGLALGITRNGNPVPASQYTVTTKSVVLKAHKATNFALKWNHGATLNAGDQIVVQACVNFLGDSTPSNNCGVKNDPAGSIAVFAWPKQTLTVKGSATNSQLGIWLTNISSFTVRPIRVADNVTVTVRVNGGPPQTATPPARTPFAIGPNEDTTGLTFTWAHAPIPKGASVQVTACAVITTNTAFPPCWSRTVTAT
jgi:hypothetical protein